MEDAHVGGLDVCGLYGVELCSGCGVGGRSKESGNGNGSRASGNGSGNGNGDESRRRESSSSNVSTSTTSTSTSGGGLSFFGVFDGHGAGGAAASFAASRLLDLVVAPGREALADDPGLALRSAFAELDLEFYRHATGGKEEEEGEAEGERERNGGTNDADAAAPPPSSSSPTPLRDCGSTALAALLLGPELVLANAGDSRAVLCSRTTTSKRSSGSQSKRRSGSQSKRSSGKGDGNANGVGDGGAPPPSTTTETPPQPHPRPPQPSSSSTSTFRQLTVDHRPSLASEKARIEAAGGTVCPEGFLNSCLGVARAIGDFSPSDRLKWLSEDETSFLGPLTSTPDVVTHRVTADDEFLLVACDGLWDVLPTARAVELARQHLKRENGDPSRAAEALVRHALSLHASDNVTALLLCFGPAGEGGGGGGGERGGEGGGAGGAKEPASSSSAPPPPASSPSLSGRPARSLSRNSLSTLSDALASCERGGGAAAGAKTATAAAALLPPLAPPLMQQQQQQKPSVVVVVAGGESSRGATRVVPSSPAFFGGGSGSRDGNGDSGSRSNGSQRSEGEEEEVGVSGRPPRPPPPTDGK